MILVDRNQVSVPSIYHSDRARKERESAWEEAQNLRKSGSDGSFWSRANESALAGRIRGRELLGESFLTALFEAAKPALLQLFSSKCAYCESPLETDRGSVEMYRPRAGARALDGSNHQLHYYWLAYEWENTLIACAHCSRAKGTRFPVAAERANLGERDSLKLDLELPYILNPCSDAPIAHFTPHEDGTLEPLTKRGDITIEVLNLNRDFLREHRKEAWQKADTGVRSILRGEARGADALAERLQDALRHTKPFLLARSVAAKAAIERENPGLFASALVRKILRHAIAPAVSAPEPAKTPATVTPGEASPEPGQRISRGSSFGTSTSSPAPATSPSAPPAGRPGPEPAPQPARPAPAAPPPARSSWLDFSWLFGRGGTPKERSPEKRADPGFQSPPKPADRGSTTGSFPASEAEKSEDGKSEWIGATRTEKGSYSIEDEDQRTRIAYFTSAKRIERFVVRNFRAIEELEIEFPSPEANRESWLMLLGENGCGKSSILQALALTLMGEEHANALGLDARRFVRRHPGVTEGEVLVHVSGLGQLRLRFSLDSESFRVEPRDPKLLLLGYGATRLLPRMARRDSSTRTAIRILNLFDPTAPLADTESWLLDRNRVSDEQFFSFRDDLIRLLMLPVDTEIYRDSGQIEMDYYGTRKALRDMSDGFQSVIALAGDISIGVSNWWGGLRDAEGIVLLDEIEVHLHPTWKISIVERLRQTCPHLCFVVTTHDPLCLKGLRPEELVVLRKNQERTVEVIRDIPRIDHLRSDQLLSSFLFNLPSTRGSGTAIAVARYSQLLGQQNRSSSEEQELAELRARLDAELSSSVTPVQKRVEKAILDSLDPKSIAGAETVASLEVLRQIQDFLSAEESP